MAVLSKIRQKSALLIAVIGIALLAFIIGDIVNSGAIGGSSRNIGSVNGEDINTREFQNKVSQAEKSNQMSSTQASLMVWNQEVNSILLGTEFEKLGLQIGKDQLVNVIKTSPMFASNPQFLDNAGQFSIAKFNTWVAQMKAGGQEQWDAWLNYEQELGKYALQQMYTSMINGGVYTTKLDAKSQYLAENSKVSFDYVTVPYSTINDDQVKVEDSEIVDFMKKHANDFKFDPTRGLEFAFVENKPSEQDKEVIKESVLGYLKPTVQYNAETRKNDTVPGFKSIKDIETFVNANSDIKFDSIYYAKKDLPLEYQEQLFNLPVGEVFGPYLFNDYYCITRMLDKKAGQKVNAAHILIGYAGAPNATSTRTKEEAKAKATEILAKATASNFATLAAEESEDPGSKGNGGKYEDIAKGQMVKPFEDFIFSKPTGSIGIVETDYGYHVIEVLGKSEGAQLATVARKIEASEATSDNIFTQATTLEAAATGGDFIAKAESMNAIIQRDITVQPFEENLPGIVGSQRQVISWSFNKDTKDGDVKRFDTTDGYIIVKLINKNETGLMPLSISRKLVEPILMNEKKAKLIKEKMIGSTIEEVSTKSQASIVSSTDVTLQNPLILNIGNEPLVVGTAFATTINANSKLIDGQKGVYMIKTKNVAQAPNLDNYNVYKNKDQAGARAAAQNKVIQALKDQASIKDNRVGLIQ